MTRRPKRHAATLCLVILATAPGYALFCRGLSPSRFAPDNLPAWERTLPRPVAPRVVVAESPLPPGTLLADDGTQSPARRARVDPEGLSSGPERPSAPDSGRPGQWLLATCAPGRGDSVSRGQQDAVAIRLMGAQRPDGSLAGAINGAWSPAQISAHGQNLRALLSYYAVCHNPAAVYAAIGAGSLVLTQFPNARAADAGADSLVLPLTLLYQATGDPRFRQWAERRARAGRADGSGLCALYIATGDRRYLRGARQVWRRDCARRRPDPDLAATLWALTGAPGYAKAMHPGPTPEQYPATGRRKAAT